MLGRLDILVNMASVYARTAYDQLTEEDWDRGLAVDLKATFLCARAAVPHMRAQGGAHRELRRLGRCERPSTLSRVPALLRLAKRAVIALTEALALELAGDQILVNAVAPGPIRPPEGLDETARAEVEHATPAGRWGGDQEIVKAVLALVDTDFTTGETIRIDGGRHLR